MDNPKTIPIFTFFGKNHRHQSGVASTFLLRQNVVKLKDDAELDNSQRVTSPRSKVVTKTQQGSVHVLSANTNFIKV